MKKSTAIIILAFIVCFSTLFAANLKLKSVYDKGEIKTLLVTKQLPSFSYIKETLNEVPYTDYRCTIAINFASDNSIAIDSLAVGNIDFNVVNDTLFIVPSKEAITTNSAMYSRININVKSLKGVTATKNIININGSKEVNPDSLQITTLGKSSVNLTKIRSKSISIDAYAASKVSIEATDSINNALINLKDKSCFSVNNVIFKNKFLSISDSCSLQLTGKSLVDFGIK